MSSAKRNMKKQRPTMTNSTEPSTLEIDVWPKIDFQKDGEFIYDRIYKTEKPTQDFTISFRCVIVIVCVIV
jgi:hypothetical protein